MTIKWKIVSNDNDTVVLRQETDEAVEEIELHRPSNVEVKAWLAMYVVGAEFGTKELHERTKFEHARRKGAGVLTASEAWTLERWNRPDHALKQVADVAESCRVFLENFGTEDIVGYARMVYLRNATKNPELAKEYAALASMEDVYRFIDKCENGAPRDTESLDELLKRAEHEGFWKGQR